MKNPALGRRVLDHVVEHREQFDMSSWGERRSCGTTACLAGWAMLLSGYTVDGDGVFRRPDGASTFDCTEEAIELLGLSDCEYLGESSTGLFYTSDDQAVERLKAIVEASEAAAVAGEG